MKDMIWEIHEIRTPQASIAERLEMTEIDLNFHNDREQSIKKSVSLWTTRFGLIVFEHLMRLAWASR